MSDDIYGDIGDEQRLDVEVYGELAAEITVHFEGKDLDRLLWAVRELGIGPTAEFLRVAALLEIERRQLRAEGASWIGPSVVAGHGNMSLALTAQETFTRTIGPEAKIAKRDAASQALVST